MQKKPPGPLHYSHSNDTTKPWQLFWSHLFEPKNSYDLTRTILDSETDGLQGNIHVVRDSQKKPRAFDMCGREIFFNVSHSQHIFCLGLAPRPIGVDVELIRPVQHVDQLASRFFSLEDKKFLEPLGTKYKSLEFLKLWTRKEALLKAVGIGIFGGLNLDVSQDTVQYANGQWVLKTTWDDEKIYTVAHEALPNDRASG